MDITTEDIEMATETEHVEMETEPEPIEMATEHAFNLKLLGLHIERPLNSTAKQIIRVNPTYSYKGADKLNMNLLRSCTTNAGRPWSPEELDLSDPGRTDLAVVVGEIAVDEDFQTKVHGGEYPKSDATLFDAAKHAAIPHGATNTVIAVARLTKGKMGIFGLGDQNSDGPCVTLPLPRSMTKDGLELFYYPEWAVASHGQKARRAVLWKQEIKKFIDDKCTELGTEDESPADEPPANESPADESTGDSAVPLLNLAERGLAKATILSALFETTKDDTYLKQQLVVLGDLAADLQKNQSARSEKCPDHRLLQKLIDGKDVISMEEAQNAAIACQRLWLRPMEGITDPNIVADSLHALARGLRSVKTRDMNVDPRLYKPFIMLFCDAVEAQRGDDGTLPKFEMGDIVNIIRKTHWRAELLTSASVEAPVSDPNPQQSGTETLVVLWTIKGCFEKIAERAAQLAQAEMDALTADVAVVPKMEDVKSPNLLRNLTEAGNVDEGTHSPAVYGITADAVGNRSAWAVVNAVKGIVNMLGEFEVGMSSPQGGAGEEP